MKIIISNRVRILQEYRMQGHGHLSGVRPVGVRPAGMMQEIYMYKTVSESIKEYNLDPG